MHGQRLPLLASLFATAALTLAAADEGEAIRTRRQAEAAEEESEDYVADYAGNDNDDVPAAGGDGGLRADDDRFDDRFGGGFNERHDDDTDANADAGDSEEEEEERPKKTKKKKAKDHEYLKKTFEFLKKVLDPNALMQNAYVTEMLRRFSHDDHHEHESQESQSSEEEHTPPPVATKRRRGRPRKAEAPRSITGMIKKGMMSLTQLELDRRKLRRRYRLIKRIARKAKRPLKTAVKIFLSSRNNQGVGVGGYGADTYGNNNY